MRILLMISFLVGSCAFAQEQTSDFWSPDPKFPTYLVGTWREKTLKPNKEYLQILEDGSTIQMLDRQVGHEGTNIPYPTACYYREIGYISYFGVSTAEEIKRATDHKYEAPEFTLRISPQIVQLIPSSQNDLACSEFVKETNVIYRKLSQASSESGFKLDSSGNLVIVWGNQVLEKVK